MNGMYAGLLPGLGNLFTDERREELKDDVTEIIKRTIIEQMIVPNATQTEDPAVIPPIVNNAIFMVSVNQQIGTRLSKEGLEDAMTTAIAAAKTPCKVDISICMSQVFLTVANPNFLDWSVFTTDPYMAYYNRPDADGEPAPVAGI